MLPPSVQSAIQFFQTASTSEISREAVMAFSTLYAFSHYYSDRTTQPITAILQKFSHIKTQEYSRVIKQKRIMSWVISRELNPVA